MRSVATRAGGGEWVLGEGELDEGSQKVQPSSHKLNNYEGCDAQYDKDNKRCSMLYTKVGKRGNPKFSS